MLKVFHLVGGINREVGGPAVTVPRLADELASAGVDATIFTPDYPWEGPLPKLESAHLVSFKRGPWVRRMGGWCPELRRELSLRALTGLDVVHNHGHWLFPNAYARQLAAEFKVPLVISPRGMLEEWSLQRSRLKKTLVWRFMEQANVRAATAFHATSETEAASIRRLGCEQPIAVIPNGVEVPDRRQLPDRAVLEKRFPELRGTRWLLFLSRLHPKKGLLELVQAWGQLTRRFPDWRLVIAGADEGGFRRQVENALAVANATETTVFTGILAGEGKAAVLANAGLFVLPTHSENFGVVVAEALAHGLPVITTTGAPWRELAEHKCGWWIDLNPSALVGALELAMRLSTAELEEMGQRGRVLMGQKYSWGHVGDQIRALYRWLGQGDERPACIV